jgi:hypothetical protein
MVNLLSWSNSEEGYFHFASGVRILVIQYKGGRGNMDPSQEGFHELSPLTPNKLLADWNLPTIQNQNPMPVTYQLGTVSPLRIGITNLCTVLSDKHFRIDTASNNQKDFRYYTKTPETIKWAENTTTTLEPDITLLQNPTNPIGILALCNMPYIHIAGNALTDNVRCILSLSYELLYLDA